MVVALLTTWFIIWKLARTHPPSITIILKQYLFVTGPPSLISDHKVGKMEVLIQLLYLPVKEKLISTDLGWRCLDNEQSR